MKRKPSAAKDFYSDGRKLLDVGLFDGAAYNFGRALRLNSKDLYALAGKAEALLGLCEMLLSRNQKFKAHLLLNAADRLCDRARKINDAIPTPWFVKAEIRRLKGQYEAALGYYARSLRLDDKNVAAWRGKAACHKKLGQLQEATGCLKKSEEILAKQRRQDYLDEEE